MTLAWTSERLRELDTRHTGWIPGLFARDPELLLSIQQMHGRRPGYAAVTDIRPVLPSSTFRKILRLQQLDAKKVWMQRDQEALGVLLASSTQQPDVYLDDCDESLRSWYESEGAQAGCEERLHFDANEDGDFDLACVHGGHPHKTYIALKDAAARIAKGGHVAISIRSPWDGGLVTAIEDSGFEFVDQVREMDHVIVPAGIIIGGGCDWVLLRKVSDEIQLKQIPSLEEDAAAHVTVQPYQWLDFDNLRADKVKKADMDAMLNSFAKSFPHKEMERSITEIDGGILATWIDMRGVSFTALLTPSENHLLITLAPYDESMEFLLQNVVVEIMGDAFTRIRPHRTHFWREENIVV